MKNTIRIALVVALATAIKMIYFFTTRVTQEQVIAFAQSIDKNMVNANGKVESALSDLSFSPIAENEDEVISKIMAEIQSAEASIQQVEVPKGDEKCATMKNAALASLQVDRSIIANEMSNVVHHIRPKEEPVQMDNVAMVLTGTISIKKSPLNDSIEDVISGIRANVDLKRGEGMQKYSDAKQALYSAYKIIMLPNLQ